MEILLWIEENGADVLSKFQFYQSIRSRDIKFWSWLNNRDFQFKISTEPTINSKTSKIEK